MDIWYGLLAFWAFVVIAKWYSWCQMRYWYSSDYREDWRPKKPRKRTYLSTGKREERRALTNLKRTVMRTLICGVVPVLGLLVAGPALSTPSSTYWTPCTIDIQPARVTHIGVDNYSNIGTSDALGQFPTDIGPEWGTQITPKLAAEYGVDVLTSPSTTPLFFNAKVGFRENVLSDNAPAVQLGFFNFGSKRGAINNQQDIVYLTFGKSLPDGRTRLAASYYYGNPASLKNGRGDVENTGYMAAFDYQLVAGKWVLAGDYASGKNAIGGGGVGVYYFFTKDVSLLAGPVWFNDSSINGKTKLTMQLDINF